MKMINIKKTNENAKTPTYGSEFAAGEDLYAVVHNEEKKIEILPVLANIIDSYYENQREMLVMCYYPSDEYLMCLSQEYNVTFVEEIDCSDISDGESRREKVVVYRVGEK